MILIIGLFVCIVVVPLLLFFWITKVDDGGETLGDYRKGGATNPEPKGVPSVIGTVAKAPYPLNHLRDSLLCSGFTALALFVISFILTATECYINNYDLLEAVYFSFGLSFVTFIFMSALLTWQHKPKPK